MAFPFIEVFSSEKILKINPATMGKITMLNIPSIIFQKSTSINSPANVFIRKGVSSGESKVAQAVKVTDKARFALAKNDITLDASPLGEEPTKMIPAAISGGKLNSIASETPMIGIIEN